MRWRAPIAGPCPEPTSRCEGTRCVKKAFTPYRRAVAPAPARARHFGTCSRAVQRVAPEPADRTSRYRSAGNTQRQPSRRQPSRRAAVTWRGCALPERSRRWIAAAWKNEATVGARRRRGASDADGSRVTRNTAPGFGIAERAARTARKSSSMGLRPLSRRHASADRRRT